MALETVDFYLRPEDGWELVATDPVSLIVKPTGFHPWWVAITASGAPAAGIEGVPMGRGGDNLRESFQTGTITGEVYIRIKDPVASTPGARAHFGVIRDEA